MNRFIFALSIALAGLVLAIHAGVAQPVGAQISAPRHFSPPCTQAPRATCRVV